MFVLPKGTLVKVGGMPFRLLEDVPTDGLEENYRLAMEPLGSNIKTSGCMPEGVDGIQKRLVGVVHNGELGVNNT